MDQVWQVIGDDKDQDNQANWPAAQGEQQKRYQQESSDDSEDDVNNEYYVAKKGRSDSFSDEESKGNDNDLFGSGKREKRDSGRYEPLAVDANGFALVKQPSLNKKARKDKEEKTTQVLTFVDMSKLKYLSRSVKNDTLSRKKIELPKNTGTAIIEAASEEDEDDA